MEWRRARRRRSCRELGAALGPPRPQTPRQEASLLDPPRRTRKLRRTNRFPPVWQKAAGKLPGNRKHKRQAENRTCSVSACLYVSPVRFSHRPRGFTALPGSGDMSMFLVKTRRENGHKAAFSGSLFGFEERTPRPFSSVQPPSLVLFRARQRTPRPSSVHQKIPARGRDLETRDAYQVAFMARLTAF